MAIDPYSGALDIASIADSASRAAYNNALAQNLGEQLALDKAKQAWLQTYQTAELTGTLNGQDTLAKGQLLGTLNGQATLPAQEDIGVVNGQPTLTAAQLYGYSGGAAGTGTPTLGLMSEQDKTALGYLQLLAGLTGPQNAFQYAKVLNGTPQGLTDIVNAASGRFGIPASGAGQMGSALASTGGSASNSAPAAVAPNGSLQIGNTQPSGSADLNSLVGSVNNPGAYQPPATSALPLPNQIDPNAWARFNPTQKSLLMADYQNQGMDPKDVDFARQQALPQYRGAQRGGIAGLFS